MWWQEDEIDPRIAFKLFEECYEYTELHLAKIPSMGLMSSYKTLEGFRGNGVIVHASKTTTTNDALRLIGMGRHASHLIIGEAEPPAYGDYLKELPTRVFAPYPIDSKLPHSGYISNRTWGIELRNVGRLRPQIIIGPESPPLPLFVAELSDNDFRLGVGDLSLQHRYFWRKNNWCTPFEGAVTRWKNYAYESPTQKQMKTLYIVIRALDALTKDGIRPQYVLPAHCITGSTPDLPTINWAHFRAAVFFDHPETMDHVAIRSYPTSVGDFERSPGMIDEELLNSYMVENDWRVWEDNGELHLLDSDLKLESNLPPRTVWKLNDMGYDVNPEAIDSSLKLFMIANKIPISDYQELHSLILRTYEDWGK